MKFISLLQFTVCLSYNLNKDDALYYQFPEHVGHWHYPLREHVHKHTFVETKELPTKEEHGDIHITIARD